EAFAATPHRWKTGDYTRIVQRWTGPFHGFEMVVASSNNGAVENISFEMPAADAIDGERFEIDYFTDIATALLNVDAAGDAEPARAWALTAARLGRKSYRSRFTSTLWFDGKGHGAGCSCQTRYPVDYQETRIHGTGTSLARGGCRISCPA